MNSPSNLITHISSCIDLSPPEAELVMESVQLVKAAKKEPLLKAGQVCREVYFVEKGCLRLFFINDKGVEQITQFAIENWWISDYMSLEKQSPSPFYIQAIEPSTLFVLSAQAQEQLVKKLPKMERYFHIVLQKAYAAAQLRLKYLHDLSKEESYRQFSSMFPAFVQRLPQYMLASYLGLTPEYLSEIRKKTP